MTAINAGIIGMGHAYPTGILTNADLEKIVDTSDEWITTRTGIKQRHKAADNEYTSQFGTAAARQALERRTFNRQISTSFSVPLRRLIRSCHRPAR